MTQYFVGLDGLPRDTDGKVPEFARKRHDFVKKYCEEKGWDRANLSIDQIVEIRKQPEWIEASK